MKIDVARAIATSWVKNVAQQEGGFCGAYFAGSTIHLTDDEELPKTSDVDVMIVTTQENPRLKLGKFLYSDVLLEVTHISWSQLASTDTVLTNYHLAGGFRHDTIITDPTGHLSRLQKRVSDQFSDAVWVRHRYEAAIEKVEKGLQALNPHGPMHDQVMWWLFPTGVTTHALLVAALKNPTVRLRYLAARDVLIDYNYTEIYDDLLGLLAIKHLTSERVTAHLEALVHVFDQTVCVRQTPFFFSSDISHAARPIAIDGSRKLIADGNHLEAIFWILATMSRCYTILEADGAKKSQQLCLSAFDALLADIGIQTTRDMINRAQQAIRFLPKLRTVAESILMANPYVTNKNRP